MPREYLRSYGRSTCSEAETPRRVCRVPSLGRAKQSFLSSRVSYRSIEQKVHRDFNTEMSEEESVVKMALVCNRGHRHKYK